MRNENEVLVLETGELWYRGYTVEVKPDEGCGFYGDFISKPHHLKAIIQEGTLKDFANTFKIIVDKLHKTRSMSINELNEKIEMSMILGSSK